MTGEGAVTAAQAARVAGGVRLRPFTTEDWPAAIEIANRINEAMAFVNQPAWVEFGKRLEPGA